MALPRLSPRVTSTHAVLTKRNRKRERERKKKRKDGQKTTATDRNANNVVKKNTGGTVTLGKVSLEKYGSK